MQLILELVVGIIAYYATFGIMGIGFAMMLRGPTGAAAAGRFFFLRPLRWIVGRARVLGISSIVTIWSFMLHRVVDPFILGVERVLIWLVTRQRGWLRQ